MKVPRAVQAQVKQDILDHFTKNKAERRVNLYLYDEVLDIGEKLGAFDQVVDLPRNTAFVLADLAPQCNWAHPCQWCLYDANTGAPYQKLDAHFPPPQLRRKPKSVKLFHAPVQPIDTQVERARWKTSIAFRQNVLANYPGERYAILFSGASNNRHVNDIEFLYRTLIDLYSFNPANIHVLNHNGTINYDGGPKPVGNWPGDNTAYRMVVNGSGTRSSFQATLANLANQIHAEDLLFIHTNNHGAGPGDGVNDYCMCVYDPSHGWAPYYVNDFVADLRVLPRFGALMVMMEQCRSGGFIAPIVSASLAAATHVATAVQPADYSLGGANFDPYAEDWIAGITGHYPDGSGLAQVVDTNGDGRISIAEAFAYADTVHHAGDTPTSSDIPTGCGAQQFLGLPPVSRRLARAMWVHGHSLQIEVPDGINSVWRAGFYVAIEGKPDTDNWFHFAIPTTVIVNDQRLRVGSVLVLFDTDSPDAVLRDVHVYDGPNKIAEHNGVNLSGNAGCCRFDVPTHPYVYWGLGISLGVHFGNGGGALGMRFHSAGCDFVI